MPVNTKPIHLMKIISWNANCKFREKYTEITKLGADIYVIQECENPETSKSPEYREFVKNGFWIGNNRKNYEGDGTKRSTAFIIQNKT